MRPLTHSHTQTRRLQRLAQRTHIRRQAKRLQRPSSVSSLYNDDRNTGTRQTPKVSSAIAEMYHCRILAEVQLAHDRHQIMVQVQGGGRVLLCTSECVRANWGTYTLHHHMHHRPTTPHKSTQLLDSSHCDKPRHDHRPSSDRSKSTSPIGPPDYPTQA